LSARDLALSVKAQASSLTAAGQGALADVSCRLADAVLDLAGELEASRRALRGFQTTAEWRVKVADEACDEAQAELAALRGVASWLLLCHDTMVRRLPVRNMDEAWEGLRAALNPGAEG
jgi:hypothetical protein